MYTQYVAQPLPIEHEGLVPVRRPVAVPVGAGLVGGLVAVPVLSLVASEGVNGESLLTVGRSGRIVEGEQVAWCTVVAVAPARMDDEGRRGAEGFLADHVRLGPLEEFLGEGMIEAVVAQTVAPAVKKERNRRMSYPLVARLVILMTLLPQASYTDVVAHAVGGLLRVAWLRGWCVPSSKVMTKWRTKLGVEPMRALLRHVSGHIVDLFDPNALWHGLRVCAIDGTHVKVPDSRANRAHFGSSGTADDSAAFPSVHLLMATARAGRAILAAVMGPCRIGEITLLHRMITESPQLFTPGHVYLFDRNFWSHDVIEKIHRRGKGAHFVIRIKEGIRLPVVTRLSEGDYLSYVPSPDGKHRVTVRVTEYDVVKTDGELSELFCLAHTFLDPTEYPKEDIAALYPHRWSASETTIGENKSTITDAGPSRGPILRSEAPTLIYQEVWGWLIGTQLVRRLAHAAAIAGGTSTDTISFTTTWRAAVRSITQTEITATTAPAAAAHTAAHLHRHILANPITTDRDRHSERAQKWRPTFRHTRGKTTTHGPLHPNFGITRRVT